MKTKIKNLIVILLVFAILVLSGCQQTETQQTKSQPTPGKTNVAEISASGKEEDGIFKGYLVLFDKDMKPIKEYGKLYVKYFDYEWNEVNQKEFNEVYQKKFDVKESNFTIVTSILAGKEVIGYPFEMSVEEIKIPPEEIKVKRVMFVSALDDSHFEGILMYYEKQHEAMIGKIQELLNKTK